MDMSVLFEAGLSVNESRVYLALLELGSASVSDITRKSGVHRVNVYDVIERLRLKGLISSVMDSGKKFYESASPDALIALLDAKKETVKGAIPELKAIYENRYKRQEVHYLKGPEGVMTAYEMMLAQNATVYGLGGRSMNRKVLKHRHQIWDKKRIEKGILVKALYYEALRKEKKSDKERLWEIKFLPDEFQTPTMIDICGSLVVNLIPHPDMNEIMAIIVDNQEVADTYRQHFEFMWQFAKE